MPRPFLAVGMTVGSVVLGDLYMLPWIGQSNVFGCEAVCNRPEDMEQLEKKGTFNTSLSRKQKRLYAAREDGKGEGFFTLQ